MGDRFQKPEGDAVSLDQSRKSNAAAGGLVPEGGAGIADVARGLGIRAGAEAVESVA